MHALVSSKPTSSFVYGIIGSIFFDSLGYDRLTNYENLSGREELEKKVVVHLSNTIRDEISARVASHPNEREALGVLESFLIGRLPDYIQTVKGINRDTVGIRQSDETSVIAGIVGYVRKNACGFGFVAAATALSGASPDIGYQVSHIASSPPLAANLVLGGIGLAVSGFGVIFIERLRWDKRAGMRDGAYQDAVLNEGNSALNVIYEKMLPNL